LSQVRKPSQRRSRQRVALILEATAEILRSRGIADVTTNSIARQAGIPVSSIYQYFPNKEAILVALYQQYLAAIEAVIEEYETPEQLAKPWDIFFTEALKAVYRQETRDQIDRELQNGLVLFPELREIEHAHRENMAARLARNLRALGSRWSTPRLHRLGLFIYELNTAAWRHRVENTVVADELLDWETAAILAVVRTCMPS